MAHARNPLAKPHLVSGNALKPEGAKALAEGLKNDKTMRELNIADNNITDYGRDMSGVIAIGDAIPTMGAMKKLTISGDESWSKPVTIHTSMIEADFSYKELGVSGAIMLAAFLPKCR